MGMSETRWKVITSSRFPWKQDALEFVRNNLPDSDLYCAWSNFEFIAEDAGTWTWETDGRLVTIDSPLILANSKAKRLRSLLQRQTASRKKGQLQ